MAERERKPLDPWDDGVYGTGPTEPPKDRGGFVAFLLILVITLCGVTTSLGILNIQLFTQLNTQEENSRLSIAFVDESRSIPTTPITEATTPMETIPLGNSADASFSLHQSPESVNIVPQEGGMALQDIYTKNIPSVVSITCTKSGGTSSGTGVILTSDGYITTNAHVVSGALSVSVRLTDDREFPAEIVGSDDVSDLAVLHIDTADLTPAEFGDSESLRVGDTVVAIGDPLGVELRGTYTDGIISAINRDVSMNGWTMTLIQTNAALNTGNSGGPLINCYGQVIGINTIKISTPSGGSASVEGLGFAIPSTTVKEIVDQLIFQGYVSGRPTLGITGEDLPIRYQVYYRLPEGLLVTQVDANSYASYYGVEPGDILLSINGQSVATMDQLSQALYSYQVGDVVTARFYQNGQQVDLNLTLTEKKG